MKIFLCFIALLLAGGFVELRKHVAIDHSSRVPRFIQITHTSSPLAFENIVVYDSKLNQAGWDAFIALHTDDGIPISVVPTKTFLEKTHRLGPETPIHIRIGKRYSKRTRYDYCFSNGMTLFYSTLYVTAK